MFICTFYHTPVAFCDRGIVFYITKGVSLMRHPLSFCFCIAAKGKTAGNLTEITEDSFDDTEYTDIPDDDGTHRGIFRLETDVSVLSVKRLNGGFTFKTVHHGDDHLTVVSHILLSD